MANAAAKKAAAARASAGQTYRPIFLCVNALYLLLRWFAYAGDAPFTFWSYVGMVMMLLLNVYCYTNLMDSIQNQGPPSKNSSDELAGGIWLDVIGIVWTAQAGTCLLSSKFYYLLLVLPPWAAYRLYSTVSGAKTGTMSAPPSTTNNSAHVSEETLKRRQQRSERRRQKRA